MSAQGGDKELLKDFKWIQDEATYERPVFEETKIANRTLGSLLMNKFSENALVPVGILATTTCLVMGLASMKKGDTANQQVFMRGRVIFQAFTFLAMGAGVILTTMKKKREKRIREATEQKE